MNPELEALLVADNLDPTDKPSDREAQYDGSCAMCSDQIKIGDPVTHQRYREPVKGKRRHTAHTSCYEGKYRKPFS